MKEQIENYWKIYQINNEWIRYSDTKAAIVLTAYGVIFTLVYSSSNNVYSALTVSSLRIFICILISILSLISIGFAFLCLNPRLKAPNLPSVIYFGHIAGFGSADEYLSESRMIIGDENKFIEQLAQQIYINSVIAQQKFRNVVISIKLFFLSFLLIGFSIFLYFVS